MAKTTDSDRRTPASTVAIILGATRCWGRWKVSPAW